METKNQEQSPAIVNPIVGPTESREFLMSAMGQEIKRFELEQRQAMMYATSTIVPMTYRGKDKLGNIIIAMDMAKRLNANLLMIMQNLNVIQGNPSWSAKFLIATVNNCGRFNPIQYKFIEGDFLGQVQYNAIVWDEDAHRNTYKTETFDGRKIKNITCIAYTTRKGNDDVLESSPVDIRTAITEGWYTKKGSKWPSMTKQMLMYRAASWWTNVYAPDLSMGLMTSEEVRDVVDAEYEEIKDEPKPNHISFHYPISDKDKEPEEDESHEEDTTQEDSKPDSPDELFK
jgi:hypothetical protein